MKLFPLAAIPVACLCGQTPPATRVIQETAIGPVLEGTLYRATVCPSGTVVVHNGVGDVVIVSKEGAILARHSAVLPENSTASACTEDNKFFAAAKGHIHTYELSPTWNIVPNRSFYVSGIGLRLLAAGDVLYVVGYARVKGTPVLIRRYRWSDGTFLGTLEPPLPLTKDHAVNRYLPEGSLLWHAATRQVLYSPANPFEFHAFDTSGRLVAVTQPSRVDFRNVAAHSLAPPLQMKVDWVVNAAALPEGHIVAHVIRRGETRDQFSGVPYSFLAVLDARMNTLASRIKVGESRFPGLLIGADAAGDLYFAKLVTSEGGTILRVRLN
jgi:hypothetical protein